MTLGFKTHISGVPTHFMEGIIKCLFWSTPVDEILANAFHHPDFDGCVLDDIHPKRHSIRNDPKRRWEAGKVVHAVIHNRTAKRFQFCPEFKVSSTQFIDIVYGRKGNETKAIILIDGVLFGEAIWINCQLKNSSFSVDELARNDGFKSTNEFFEYFSEDFSGVIIHWTNLRYG